MAPQSPTGIQNRAQGEFLEKMPGHQNRSPRGGPRSRDVRDGNPARVTLRLGQQPDQGIQMRPQQVLASQVSDDALLDLVPFAEGLHQAEILLLSIA